MEIAIDLVPYKTRGSAQRWYSGGSTAYVYVGYGLHKKGVSIVKKGLKIKNSEKFRYVISIGYSNFRHTIVIEIEY